MKERKWTFHKKSEINEIKIQQKPKFGRDVTRKKQVPDDPKIHTGVHIRFSTIVKWILNMLEFKYKTLWLEY